jgi:putative lipoic acid-binding regulatory protein
VAGHMGKIKVKGADAGKYMSLSIKKEAEHHSGNVSIIYNFL